MRYAHWLGALPLLLLVGCQGHTDASTHPDPLAGDQWYLDGRSKGYIDIDLPLDASKTRHGFRLPKGRGVLVAIVDNGIDIYHEDLLDNIGEGSHSYLPEKYDFTYADHGTCCAGIIAAVEGNGKGIRGIAPEATIIGYNALKAPSISNIADAFVRNKEKVWISSNSWGDFNAWGEPLTLRTLEKDAFREGVTHGRNGRGIIYVFSAGNGSSGESEAPTDNVNYSGLVNNRFTIPVGAVDEHGKKAFYSEEGATLVVTAPSKARIDGPGIVTTDVTGKRGFNAEVFKDDYADTNYTKNFSGTSASAPMVSGVVALMLEARPDLGWRDVSAILAMSAAKNDPTDTDWQVNSAGLHVNHKYGFGLLDAQKAIDLSRKWHNFPQEKMLEKVHKLNRLIPDNNQTGISDTIHIDENITVEFVSIMFDAPDHPRLGDLEVTLVSPEGTSSVLAQMHNEMFASYFRYRHWNFGTRRCLNESSAGDWKLIVKDLRADGNGTVASWGLKIYGHAQP